MVGVKRKEICEKGDKVKDPRSRARREILGLVDVIRRRKGKKKVRARQPREAELSDRVAVIRVSDDVGRCGGDGSAVASSPGRPGKRHENERDRKSVV